MILILDEDGLVVDRNDACEEGWLDPCLLAFQPPSTGWHHLEVTGTEGTYLLFAGRGNYEELRLDDYGDSSEDAMPLPPDGTTIEGEVGLWLTDTGHILDSDSFKLVNQSPNISLTFWSQDDCAKVCYTPEDGCLPPGCPQECLDSGSHSLGLLPGLVPTLNVSLQEPYPTVEVACEYTISLAAAQRDLPGTSPDDAFDLDQSEQLSILSTDLDGPDDEDWYSFDVEEGERITVDIYRTEGAVDPMIELYAPLPYRDAHRHWQHSGTSWLPGAPLLRDEDGAVEDRGGRLHFIAPYGGRFSVRVVGENQEAGPYWLALIRNSHDRQTTLPWPSLPGGQCPSGR